MRDRLQVALEACLLLGVPVFSFCVCLYAFGQGTTSTVGLALIPPCVGLVSIFLLLCFDGKLSAGRRVVFPMNLTVPAVHATITWCVADLFGSPAGIVSAVRAAPLRIWLQPQVVGIVVFCQILALTFVMVTRRAPQAESPTSA